MDQELDIGGVRYISSKRAAELSDYTQDYIGQLARAGTIDARRVSGLWYVSLDSLSAHKKSAESYVPVPPTLKKESAEMQTSVSLDGRSYISSARAAKITGYTADYIGQLARTGKIMSRQVGNRWYIDQEALLAHKQEKDALLASIQAESVGIQKTIEVITNEPVKLTETPKTHFSYVKEERDLIPVLQTTIKPFKIEEAKNTAPAIHHDGTFTSPIPIRVIHGSNSSHVGLPIASQAQQIEAKKHNYPSAVRPKYPPEQKYLPEPSSLRFPMLMGAGTAALTVVIVLAMGIGGLAEKSIYAKRIQAEYSVAASSASLKLKPVFYAIKDLITVEIIYKRTN